MKILLPVDGSRPCLHMLSLLGARPELLPGRHDYVALAVVEPVHPGVAAYLPGSANAYCEEEAHAVLEPVRRFATQHGWDLQTRYAVGPPGPKIARLANDGGFDLVVMGTHGHGAATGLVLGSVSNQVLAQCRVPVLLMPWRDERWVMVSPGAFGAATTH